MKSFLILEYSYFVIFLCRFKVINKTRVAVVVKFHCLSVGLPVLFDIPDFSHNRLHFSFDILFGLFKIVKLTDFGVLVPSHYTPFNWIIGCRNREFRKPAQYDLTLSFNSLPVK